MWMFSYGSMIKDIFLRQQFHPTQLLLDKFPQCFHKHEYSQCDVLPSKCKHVHLKPKMYCHEVALCSEPTNYWLTYLHDMRLKPECMIIHSTSQPLVFRVINLLCQTVWKWSEVNGTMLLHLLQCNCSIPAKRSISRGTKLKKNAIYSAWILGSLKWNE